MLRTFLVSSTRTIGPLPPTVLISTRSITASGMNLHTKSTGTQRHLNNELKRAVRQVSPDIVFVRHGLIDFLKAKEVI